MLYTPVTLHLLFRYLSQSLGAVEQLPMASPELEESEAEGLDRLSAFSETLFHETDGRILRTALTDIAISNVSKHIRSE